MEYSELTAISPIDGRYRSKTEELAPYFSEFALLKYRVRVEVEYFIALCEIPLPQLAGLDKSIFPKLREVYSNFSISDAARIKSIEKTTNHDVKAVEYFIKEKLDGLNLKEQKEFIHFGLTSQDINNTAVPLSVKEAMKDIYIPFLETILLKLKTLSQEYASVSLLARTHGQAASPTRLGKEFMVYVERLENQLNVLKAIPHAAKFGGATGNFNAHHIAYPEVDWKNFANAFVDKTLGLQRSQYTTQIEHYDSFASLCDCIKRINTILIDLNRDIWTYISMDYFKQKIKPGEIGSSAMPHKVNPIDFENSEGNLGIANALLEHLSAKLPISRLQRDLTDSTVLRNVGMPFSHSLLALKSLLQGLNKLVLNPEKIAADLEDNWAVIAEAIQTILRRENYPNPYETLKDLTRTHEKPNAKSFADFIEKLNVSEAVKSELKKISPHNYTGI
ncbi:MAG: adenylosuccinate lyase [Bacteroidetes bacterium]|nr:adenylosuccinate lyase [Bacteroidota bacterium]